MKRGDIISSMSKTYSKYWTPWLVGRCREAWYTLSLSTARPRLTDPCGVFACGRLLRRGIVTNRTKSLRRLVGDRLICHFGGERSCGVLSASSRWRISSVVWPRTWQLMTLRWHLHSSPLWTRWTEILWSVVHFFHYKRGKMKHSQMPTCQRPRRNPPSLLRRVGWRVLQNSPCVSSLTGAPCRPLIWLPAWPTTPPAQAAYVAEWRWQREVSHRLRLFFFHTAPCAQRMRGDLHKGTEEEAREGTSEKKFISGKNTF